MSKRAFTQEEVEELRGNKYTYSVTERTLCFTKEFKELFMFEFKNGKRPKQILISCGYDPEMLGQERVWGIAHSIKGQDKSLNGVHEGSIRKKTEESKEKKYELIIKKLKEEIQSLRQEVSRLKHNLSRRKK